MKKGLKDTLFILGGSVLMIGLIGSGALSRLGYAIWDAARTKEIVERFENGKEDPVPPAADYRKAAYVTVKEAEEAGNKTKTYDILALTSASTYELTHYVEVYTATSSYSSEYFHMSGDYTREVNNVTISLGIGLYSTNYNNGGFVHHNAQFATAEEANGEETREDIYALKYSSKTFALMSNGSFVMDGTSDSEEELAAPEGVKVYSTKTTQGRITLKTLITFDNGDYLLYSQATNSNNHEQTTGCFFGSGKYVINDDEKAIAPDETKPEETYSIVRGEVGLGYMYANNNGSHMQFDLRTGGQFSQWLATSFNATTPTFYVTETGFTIKIGALKETVGKWGLYIPAADNGGEDKPVETTDIKLEVASSIEDKPFILELKGDGTAKTGWTNYEQTLKEGTWYTFGKTIIVDVEGYDAICVENVDGTHSIIVDYGAMGAKTFYLEEAQYETAKKNSKPMRIELASSIEGKPFIIDFNADGTLKTGWTNYESTIKDGTWSFEDGNLVITVDGYAYTLNAVTEDGATFSIDYGAMGSKDWTIGAIKYVALKENAPKSLGDIHLEVETTVEGKPFILDLYKDGTCKTGWTNYEQTIKTGTWSVFGSSIIIEVEGYKTSVEYHANGIVSITIDYGAMGSKSYDLGAEQYETLKVAASPLTVELETSVEGKPFILEFNADGSVKTGWTNYDQTIKEGKWSIVNDELLIEVEGYAYTFNSEVDGEATITINYGTMGEKEYKISAAKYAALKNEAVVGDIHMEVATSVPDKPFILDVKADGTVTTGWTNYAQTIKDGTWSIFGGKLVIAVAGYSVDVVYNDDGTLDISIDYGAMGSKTYKMSANDWNAIKGNESNIRKEIETSVEGKPFVLEFNGDGSLTTGWTNYAQTIKTATWSSFGGKINLNLDGTGYTSTITYNEDGSVDITINYGAMGEKTYTLSSAEHEALKANSTPISYALDTSVEGKPFILEFNANGSVKTGWTNYAQTIKEGTWAYSEGALTITVEGYTTTVTPEADGSATIVINYGAMGEKTWVISAADYALLAA